MKALDHMIENGIYEYYADTWSYDPAPAHYDSLKGQNGQVNYNGEIFVVTQRSSRNGMGGMDQGSPASVSITRIKQ